MAAKNVQPYTVYLDGKTAAGLRTAVAEHGGNVSSFIRLLVEEKLASGKRPDSERRMLEYLVGGINQVLADRDPARLKEHQRRHAERMAQGKSYAD